MAAPFTPTPRTRVKRLHERGHYDRETVHAILDAGVICHVSYVIDGQPYVTPTSYWRHDDRLYWHGSSASRMLRHLKEEVPACVAVTHFDGFVLARSGFHHSINYRSVMAFGSAQLVPHDEKLAALEDFVERLFPGRWAELRPPTRQEIKATTVLRMPLEEVSAKVRTGPPKDDEEDYALPIWARFADRDPARCATIGPAPQRAHALARLSARGAGRSRNRDSQPRVSAESALIGPPCRAGMDHRPTEFPGGATGLIFRPSAAAGIVFDGTVPSFDRRSRDA